MVGWFELCCVDLRLRARGGGREEIPVEDEKI